MTAADVTRTASERFGFARPTVVVSPVVALQRDEVESLAEREAASEAAHLSSAVRASERRKSLDELEQGELEHLLPSPEQLGEAEVRERVRAAEPSLFVVDEAQCISESGLFRPDYPCEGPSGNCDNCEAGHVRVRHAREEPYAIGGRVLHPEWGGGVVHGYDDGRVTVLFDAVVYRTLGLDLVAERGLLEPEGA